MPIDSLIVIHRWKQAGTHPFASDRLQSAARSGRAFFLDTCQRQIWISTREFPGADSFAGVDLDHFHGAGAYRFLLMVCAGLQSAIPGETDIFGQFKDAWRGYDELILDCDHADGVRRNLRQIIQKLFADTKEIRSRHLQGIGGASYGSLVRRFLRDHESDGPVLLVGAGKLARSVAPYLAVSDRELWLWNRDATKLDALREHILTRPRKGTPGVCASPAELPIRFVDDEERAWRDAAHVVVCIPGDDSRDGKRIGFRQDADAARGSVLHLGLMSHEAGPWTELEGFRALDELFRLQTEQDEVRAAALENARHACRERALEREREFAARRLRKAEAASTAV